jgi:4-aminobutyrate aminotransferase/(S)-3-amino-2-methylpropionate transaminase
MDGQSVPQLFTAIPGPRSRELASRLTGAECPSFDARRRDRERESGAAQHPIVYAEGRGSNVIDVDGNRYVDFVAGFGALPFGHCPDFIDTAVRAQSTKLGLALGDVYGSDVKLALLEALRSLHPEAGARVMLGLSGADAVTAALKTAMLSTGKAGVIAFEGSYHGLSHGPLAVCGLKASFRDPFVGQTGAFARFAPYPDGASALSTSLSAVDAALAAGDVGAILVEPVLGRGGVVVPPPEFLPELDRRCRARGARLIVDEIWTGLGRSGVLLASERANVVPDLICVGKALGGGVPISACIGRHDVMEAWATHGGTTLHTATHFGAPPACAAALAVLSRLREPGFLEGVSRRGNALRAALTKHVRHEAIRGAGLMVGIAIPGGARSALRVMRGLLDRGYLVLTGGSTGDVITLTPALMMNEALFDPFADAFGAALAASA